MWGMLPGVWGEIVMDRVQFDNSTRVGNRLYWIAVAQDREREKDSLEKAFAKWITTQTVPAIEGAEYLFNLVRAGKPLPFTY